MMALSRACERRIRPALYVGSGCRREALAFCRAGKLARFTNWPSGPPRQYNAQMCPVKRSWDRPTFVRIVAVIEAVTRVMTDGVNAFVSDTEVFPDLMCVKQEAD